VNLKNGDVLETAFETYTVSGHLGEGGSGVVYEIRDPDGARFAAKTIDRAKAGRIRLKRFKNEADFCSRNRHKNIIRVIGSGLTDVGASSFYVMPLFPRTLWGDLGRHANRPRSSVGTSIHRSTKIDAK
jgi:serine/threonine protein kinase